MERLTKRTDTGIAYLAKVREDEQAVEASKHTCECIYESWQQLAAYEDAMPLERAQELAKAEAEGRVKVFPYKVGDTVYAISQDYCEDEDGPDEYFDYVEEVYIDIISWTANDDGDDELLINDYLHPDDVYRTREEAEAALESEKAEHEQD